MRTQLLCVKQNRIMALPAISEENNTFQEDSDEVGAAALETEEEAERDKLEENNDKEAKLGVKVDPSDLNWEDEIKGEPESDLEETAEETDEDDDNFNESTETMSSSCEPTLDDDESKHDIKVKIENLEEIEYETNVWAQTSSGKKKRKQKMGRQVVASEKERTCQICGKIFKKKLKMLLHLVLHTKVYAALDIEDKVLKSECGTSVTCLECGKILSRLNHIKPHIAQVHYQLHKTLDMDDIDNFDLSEGGTALKVERTKKKKIKKTYLCEFCEKQFADCTGLKRHIRFTHEGLPRRPKSDKAKETVMCEFCDKRFSDNGGLTRHKRFKHEGFGFECDLCDYSAQTPLGLVRHRSAKHGINLSEVPAEVSLSSHQCMDCGKFYNSTTSLKRHQLVHAGIRPFTCNLCEKRFTQKSTLEGHRRIHTGEMPYSCNICDFKFKTSAAARDHQIQIHQGGEKISSNSNFNYSRRPKVEFSGSANGEKGYKDQLGPEVNASPRCGPEKTSGPLGGRGQGPLRALLPGLGFWPDIRTLKGPGQVSEGGHGGHNWSVGALLLSPSPGAGFSARGKAQQGGALPDLCGVDGQEMLTDGQEMPTHNRELPTHGRELLTHSTELLTHIQELPTHSRELPTHCQKLPTNDQELQTHGREQPTNSRELPTPSREEPTHGRGLPTHSRELPIHFQKLPTHGRELLTHCQELPTHDQELLTHGQEQPTHSREMPTHSRELPTHGRELPTHDKELPKHGQEQPTHVRELLTHGRELLTHGRELSTHGHLHPDRNDNYRGKQDKIYGETMLGTETHYKSSYNT